MSTRQKAVYVRYWDHVFFRNIQTPGAVAVIRETVGWVKKENDQVMLIECDRPLRKGCGGLNGLVILKIASLQRLSCRYRRILSTI